MGSMKKAANSKKSQKPPLTAGEGTRRGKNQSPTPYTDEDVLNLLSKRVLTLNQVQRLLMFYLVDIANGQPFRVISNEQIGNLMEIAYLKDTPFAQRMMNFYITALEALNCEKTCLQRRAFREARKALLTPLCFYVEGGESKYLDYEMELRNHEVVRHMPMPDTEYGNAVRAVMTDSDMDDMGYDRARFSPFQLVQTYISEFYALAAVLDVAQKVYGIPELTRLRHPYAILPHCEGTAIVYNSLRHSLYKNCPKVDPQLFPPLDLDALKPKSKELGEIKEWARKNEKIDSIAIDTNRIQSVTIWTLQ